MRPLCNTVTSLNLRLKSTHSLRVRLLNTFLSLLALHLHDAFVGIESRELNMEDMTTELEVSFILSYQHF
jgi:hypothetical protein